MCKISAHKKDYVKIEKQNISINVFSYKDETPYHIYTSKQTFEKYADLLQSSNCKNSHYVLMKDFNRFITNKTKLRKQFCWYCLQCFSSSRVLKCHVKNCLAINDTKSNSWRKWIQ